VVSGIASVQSALPPSTAMRNSSRGIHLGSLVRCIASGAGLLARLADVLLYTCGQKKRGPAALHPCARAGKALDAAGYTYEIKVVGGYRLLPTTWGSRDEERAEVRELSGTNEVPILVLDDGEVISGSGTIALWAGEHPAAQATAQD